MSHNYQTLSTFLVYRWNFDTKKFHDNKFFPTSHQFRFIGIWLYMVCQRHEHLKWVLYRNRELWAVSCGSLIDIYSENCIQACIFRFVEYIMVKSNIVPIVKFPNSTWIRIFEQNNSQTTNSNFSATCCLEEYAWFQLMKSISMNTPSTALMWIHSDITQRCTSPAVSVEKNANLISITASTH